MYLTNILRAGIALSITAILADMPETPWWAAVSVGAFLLFVWSDEVSQ